MTSTPNLHEPASTEAAGRADGQMLAAISNRIVQLHKHHYGRGPTKARTIHDGDLVVCLLEGGFTRIEQTLMDRGKRAAVYQQRHEVQEALEQEFTTAVSELTGRRVEAFMSANHQDPNLMCEIFVLGDSLGPLPRAGSQDGRPTAV